MFEDEDLLRLHEPPRLRARADITERILRRMDEERQRKRERRANTYRIAAGVSSAVFCLMVWRWLTQPVDGRFVPPPAARVKPPRFAPVPRPASIPALATPQTTTVQVKEAHRPKKKTTQPPPAMVVQTDTTGTVPAPQPKLRPYRPPVALAIETFGPDGQPVTPTSPPMIFIPKRHPKATPPPTDTTGTPPATPAPTTTEGGTPPATSTATTTAPPDGHSEELHYNARHEFTGVSVHIGALTLTLDSDAQNAHLKAGNMLALLKQRDVDGRDVALVAEGGAPVAEIGLNADALPETITLGNGVKLTVVRQRDGQYRQTLFASGGKKLAERVIDSLPWSLPDPVYLDPVARDLGLSPAWREEIAVEAAGRLQTVTRKTTGETLLYIVRSGPDRAGFLPDGTPLFYDVEAMFDFGRARHTERYGDLQSLVPNHFVYTRDGRIGAYARTPAAGGIASFWTERDASSGETRVHVATPAPPPVDRAAYRPPPCGARFSVRPPCGADFSPRPGVWHFLSRSQVSVDG